MICYAMRMAVTRPDVAKMTGHWLNRIDDLLAGCIRDRDVLPAGQSIDVRFDDFMADERGHAGRPLPTRRSAVRRRRTCGDDRLPHRTPARTLRQASSTTRRTSSSIPPPWRNDSAITASGFWRQRRNESSCTTADLSSTTVSSASVCPPGRWSAQATIRPAVSRRVHRRGASRPRCVRSRSPGGRRASASASSPRRPAIASINCSCSRSAAVPSVASSPAHPTDAPAQAMLTQRLPARAAGL